MGDGFVGDMVMKQPDLFGTAPAKVRLDPHWATRVRAGDPGTSYAAAKSWDADRLTEIQERVWAILRNHTGLTDRELIVAYRDQHGLVAESTVRTRRKELVERGLVEGRGERDHQTIWAVR
jgi:hypothetical protein